MTIISPLDFARPIPEEKKKTRKPRGRTRRPAMFKRRLTRAGLENLLGGDFGPVNGQPGARTNGRFITFLRLHQDGRRLKCIKPAKGGRSILSDSWLEIGQVLKVV